VRADNRNIGLDHPHRGDLHGTSSTTITLGLEPADDDASLSVLLVRPSSRILEFVRVVRGTVAGCIGGLLAAGAMSLAHVLISAAVSKSRRQAEQESPKEEDATVKVAAAVVSSFGYQLTEDDKSKAGTVVHYAFGGGVGAVYGALAELSPNVRIGLGLPFGVAVWLGAHVITVPALGLAKPPTQQPPSKEAQELGLHLLYGLTTEYVRRLLRRE